MVLQWPLSHRQYYFIAGSLFSAQIFLSAPYFQFSAQILNFYSPPFFKPRFLSPEYFCRPIFLLWWAAYAQEKYIVAPNFLSPNIFVMVGRKSIYITAPDLLWPNFFVTVGSTRPEKYVYMTAQDFLRPEF